MKGNPYWEKVKRKVRVRDDFKCFICAKTIKLETHHITYQVNGKSIIGKELDHLEWIVTLCEDHHQQVHERKDHPLNPKNPKKRNINHFKN